MPVIKETLEETKAKLGRGVILFGSGLRPPQAELPAQKPERKTKLPPAPLRECFSTEDKFDEARCRWQETVGRINAMAARVCSNQ